MLRGLADSTFTVMSCNVAGLPAIISSGNPAANSVELGKRLSGWDIVNMQEDFNYHAQVYSQNTHPYRTATSGGVPFGSGLNTMSRFPFSNITDIDRVKWTKCNNDEGADCLTPKGFTFLEIQLADGVTFDLYNLHTDAGTKDADLVARRANLDQIGAYIAANSKDNAVIVMGDTNTRYTRTGDNIASFASGLGLTDGWVSKIRNGVPPAAGADALVCDEAAVTNDCEVVDKIMFRGNNHLKFNLESWSNENAAFLDSAGKPLSDHFPIAAKFSWSLNPSIRLSNAVGGPHGTQFTDVASAAAGQTVSSITIRGANRVDAVSLTVSAPKAATFTHGGTGGTASTLTLAKGEYIKSLEAHWGQKDGRTRIFYLSAVTSTGRSVAAGTKTSESTIVYAPAGFQISGFHGRAGDEVDAIGAIYTKL
ncbi:Phospholipase d gamma 3, partial [Globisporangium splendens]